MIKLFNLVKKNFKYFLIFITLFINCLPSKSQNSTISTKCIAGYLYYHWNNRPFGVCVPVLNTKTNSLIKCNDYAEWHSY